MVYDLLICRLSQFAEGQDGQKLEEQMWVEMRDFVADWRYLLSSLLDFAPELHKAGNSTHQK